MKAIILAAGYATRLRPLTDSWAKELLPVGGRPIIDWILDAVDASGEVDEVHVVTNARKAAWFEEWARGRTVVVHDDGTTSNDDRLGAIGDMQFVVERAAIATYVYHRDHVALIRAYLDAGESADQPGRFVAWLCRREPVYGWVFDSTWYDIGNHEQLLEADNRMRAEAGLPERASYSPS